MGNAVGVFQAGEACVFSIARLSECPRKLGWCSVVEAAVRADFVVLLSPAGDFYSRVEQVREPAGAQALLAQLAMEALHVSVLHGPAGLDVAQVDLPLQCPGQEVAAGKLRAVVAADGFGSAARADQVIEYTGDATAGKASVHL